MELDRISVSAVVHWISNGLADESAGIRRLISRFAACFQNGVTGICSTLEEGS